MSVLSPAISSLVVCQFLRFTDAGDDVLHVIDGNGLDTLLVQFCKQLRDAGLDVVDDFIAAFLLPE